MIVLFTHTHMFDLGVLLIKRHLHKAFLKLPPLSRRRQCMHHNET